jgi:tRNA dimethylallyltransferase
MDIGTDKPSEEVLRSIPHHLVDIVEPNETWTLAEFNREVEKTIEWTLQNGKLPILVGGTGQYFRSLVEGWEIPEIKPNLEMRKAIEDWGMELGAIELHKKMSILDEASGESIQPQNMRRTIRALEVIFSTGRKFSELRVRKEPIYDFKVIGLSRQREELYKVIDERIERMFEIGFIREVETLLRKGYTKDLPAMSAIGYREVMQYLDGEITLEEAKLIMKRKTRQFVRRQANWFSKENKMIEWFAIPPDPTDAVIKSVQSWLMD